MDDKLIEIGKGKLSPEEVIDIFEELIRSGEEFDKILEELEVNSDNFYQFPLLEQIEFLLDNGIENHSQLERLVKNYIKELDIPKGIDFSIIDDREFDTLSGINSSLSAPDNVKEYNEIYGHYVRYSRIINDRLEQEKVKINSFNELYNFVDYHIRTNIDIEDIDGLDVEVNYLEYGLELSLCMLKGDTESLGQCMIDFIIASVIYNVARVRGIDRYKPRDSRLRDIDHCRQIMFDVWSDEYTIDGTYNYLTNIATTEEINLKEILDEQVDSFLSVNILNKVEDD